jgi:hypothetical protein
MRPLTVRRNGNDAALDLGVHLRPLPTTMSVFSETSVP